ncbi:Rossmann-like domain-containing protein [Chloroflexota bacterium]
MALIPVLDEARERFSAIIAEHQLGDETVQVNIGPLSAKAAIGSPGREDLALLEGKEVMIEARFAGSFGQAFTDLPQDFQGTIEAVQSLNLTTASNRAIFISTLNSVMAHLGMVTGIRHCRDDEPERCGLEISRIFREKFGTIKVGLAGLQPAILENLIGVFGAHNVRCSDLNPKNISSNKFEVEIWNGKKDSQRLIDWSNVLLVTSSTLVNGTFDYIRGECTSQRKQLMTFGVTGAGVCALLGLERICPFGH